MGSFSQAQVDAFSLGWTSKMGSFGDFAFSETGPWDVKVSLRFQQLHSERGAFGVGRGHMMGETDLSFRIQRD